MLQKLVVAKGRFVAVVVHVLQKGVPKTAVLPVKKIKFSKDNIQQTKNSYLRM